MRRLDSLRHNKCARYFANSMTQATRLSTSIAAPNPRFGAAIEIKVRYRL